MSIGSKTKASWADPVKRNNRIAAMTAARERNAAGLGPSAEVPRQLIVSDRVRVESIPRDRVEMELFGARP